MKIKRCKHGFVEGQCHVCKTGPVGFSSEQDTTRDNKIDRLKLLKRIGSRINRERREIHEQLKTVGAQCLCPNKEGEIMSEVKTKICRKCEKEKPLTKENYVPNALCKDGFEGTCKKCKAEHSKARREEKKAESSKLKAGGIAGESRPKVEWKEEDAPFISGQERMSIEEWTKKICDSANMLVKPSDQDHRFVGEAYRKPFDLTAVIAEYPGLLEKITELAKEEMRTVEMQAVYMLMKSVNFSMVAKECSNEVRRACGGGSLTTNSANKTKDGFPFSRE